MFARVRVVLCVCVQGCGDVYFFGGRLCNFNFPPGLLEDFVYYFFNNHGFASAFCAEKDHPFSRIERNAAFMSLGALTYFGVSVGAAFSLTQNQKILWNSIIMSCKIFNSPLLSLPPSVLR